MLDNEAPPRDDVPSNVAESALTRGGVAGSQCERT